MYMYMYVLILTVDCCFKTGKLRLDYFDAAPVTSVDTEHVHFYR